MGMVLEMLFGKLAMQDGKPYDDRAFQPRNLADVEARLLSYGLAPKGQEMLMNGCTGHPMQARIYMGVCTYQRLKHQVVDKLYQRKTGPVSALCRQPAEGRAVNGGLRLGEMERDVLLAHNVPAIIEDRLLHNSDGTVIGICAACGDSHWKKGRICVRCGGNTRTNIKTPYAFQTMRTELAAMSIMTRLDPSKLQKCRT